MSYATLAEARDAGITTTAYGTDLGSDARVQRLLDEATAWIDRCTGWWFSPRALTLTFDGDDTGLLWLPAPIIALTSVSLGGTALTLTGSDREVYAYGYVTAQTESERRNARLVRNGTARWVEGQQNVSVVGTFGYTLANGTSPPPEIRDVCIRLALRSIGRIADASAQAERRRPTLFRESTDGHSYELLGGVPGVAGSWRQGGATGDPEIDTALAAFRRPFRGGVL